MSSEAASLPVFVELPGNSVGRIPYRARGATLHGFLFRADRKALQRTCDRCLTAPSKGALRFTVLAPYVLLTALYVERMSSADPIDKSKGFVREADIGFWIPVVGGPPGDLLSWRVYWLPSYMFVDSGSALSAGREVFGYPKLLCLIDRTTELPPSKLDFAIATEHFSTFGPDAEGKVRLLFEVASPGHAADGAFGQNASASDIAGAMWSLFSDQFPADIPIAPFGDAVLPYTGMPMVFLKQFRDHRFANRACFQAITEVTATISKLHAARLVPAEMSLAIQPSASHPIELDLGIADGTEASLVMSAALDFDVGFGSTLATIRE